MTPEVFETCAKNNDGQVECALTLEPLTRENAIMLPSASGNKQCFERSAIQEMLKRQKIHPLTRERVSEDWINTWYPGGVNAVYRIATGGKRKTRKSKKSKKRKQTRKRKQRH